MKNKQIGFTTLHPESPTFSRQRRDSAKAEQGGDEVKIKIKTSRKPRPLGVGVTGFTLVEIITVMAIVSLLVSLAVVEGVKFRRLANESNCQANLKAIATAFEVYAASHGGAYAPATEYNLQFLTDAGCLITDLVAKGQVGTFRYSIARVWPGGYDIWATASSSALAEHNYQIVTGGILRRSNTSSSEDQDFRDF